jgi:adenosylcobinamide hydrolase
VNAGLGQSGAFPGVTVSLTSEALVVCSERSLRTLSSAVVGGGFIQARCIVNCHVHKNYDNRNPASDLLAFARTHGLPVPFVGLMTAVYMEQARASTVHDGDMTVTALVTAGVGNLAAPGLSLPVRLVPGTINMVLLVDGHLTPGAMVNAVVTASEVKARVLLERDMHTPDGYPATGTSTDAVVIACTGRGDPLSYAGPMTHVGWLIGRSLHQALDESLRKGEAG